MAITILQSPAATTPVYNPVVSLVSSTNTAQTNFKYVLDVYITGQTFAGQSYLRMKAPANPTYGNCVFDVSGILERYLSYNVGNDIYGFQASTSSIIEYQLKFGEEYGQSSAIIVYPNLTVDSARYAWNGGVDFLPFTSYTQADYVTGSATRKQLTTHPTNTSITQAQPIRSGESAWTGVLLNTSGDIKIGEVRTYDSSANLLQVYNIINWQYYDINPVGERFLRFPTGYNLDSISQSDLIGGQTQPIVSGASVKYWSVSFRNSSNNLVTELRYFVKDTKCTQQTEYRLHFLNKLGNFDSFTFTGASHFTTDIKRKKYEKPAGKYITSTSYGFAAKDQGDINFYTELKDTIKLESDWQNEDVFTWLEELVSSPVIFHDDSTYGLVPVNITDTKHTRKKRITEKLFNLEISIQYSFNRFRQRA